MAEPAATTARLVHESMESSGVRRTAEHTLGRKVGRAAILLAGLRDIIDAPEAFIDPEQLPTELRRSGRNSIVATRRAQQKLGVYPSLAQLADPDAPLPVHLRNNRALQPILVEAHEAGLAEAASHQAELTRSPATTA